MKLYSLVLGIITIAIGTALLFLPLAESTSLWWNFVIGMAAGTCWAAGVLNIVNGSN